MIPTPIGVIVILIGVWLLFRPAIEMMAFVLVASLLSGASAIDAPVLGHSSIPPAMLALGFLGLRLLRIDVRRSIGWSQGLAKNGWIITFCVYAALTAFILPRMFADRIDLIPMGRSIAGYLPLQPSSQNITQAVYVLATGFAAIAGTVLATRPRAAPYLAGLFVTLTWVQVGSGIADIVASLAHAQSIFDVFRNGAYAQLTQDTGDFHRISGLTPEPSAYATLSFVFLVMNTELWLRSVMPVRTGMAALAMLIMMLLSTSSTAYGSVFFYAMLILARAICVPNSISIHKLAVLGATAAAAFAGGIVIVLVKPHAAETAFSTLLEMTVHKTQSLSGLERGLWAKQGWDAFIFTRGLGVGIGSFRSSGLLTAIIGSVGPAGLMILGGYCLQTLRLGRRATYTAAGVLQSDIGASVGWTAVLSLVPAAFSSPTADPGVLFALLAGMSLGLRRVMWRGASRTPERRPTTVLAGPVLTEA